MKKQKPDIRWHQRLENFSKALANLNEAVNLSRERELTGLEKQGLIQSFEFTHELGWNLLRDYLFFQGHSEISGSRDAAREAFRAGLIRDGDGWMAMIKSRNQTSHTYNQSTADEIVNSILSSYFELFQELKSKMESLRNQ